MTCYLCDPDADIPAGDERDVWNEACADCDRAFWENPVYRLPEPDPGGA